ncbi:MAG TPA: DUF1003 domain-containing protein [Methylovirgula sp.]|nr:DUF1003 domain-containing protein [Methylovirgula sp.]
MAESQTPSVLSRNIAALSARRQQEQAAVGWEDRLARQITKITGSMTFVYLQLAAVGIWVLINVGLLPVVPRWDPHLVFLGTTVSVEAIFLSTFILISQNRMVSFEDKRAELDLQVSLLAEHELTKTVSLVSAIAEKLNVKVEIDPQELEEIKRDVAPETMLDKLDEQAREADDQKRQE